MEVFTSNMTIAVIMVHSECPEMPNSRRNRERSHLSRSGGGTGSSVFQEMTLKFYQLAYCPVSDALLYFLYYISMFGEAKGCLAESLATVQQLN